MLPSTVRVGHMVFGIEQNDVECDAMGSDGHCAVGSRRIVLRTNLPPDREREVVLHEVIHAAMGVSGLTWDDDTAEEKIVHALTGPMLTVLRRNRRLMTYLTE